MKKLILFFIVFLSCTKERSNNEPNYEVHLITGEIIQAYAVRISDCWVYVSDRDGHYQQVYSYTQIIKLNKK